MATYTINKFTYNNNTYKLKDVVSGYGTATNWYNGTGTGSVYTEGANSPTSIYSVAEGYNNWVNGNYSHIEGNITCANGNYSHAEGYYTYADGEYSHAEGYNTYAIGNYSHAEGYRTSTYGNCSHAEGDLSTANGNYSHAEGSQTIAEGNYSHAGGYKTIADFDYQTVIGKYNNNNSANAFEIGWGTDDISRQNIFQVGTNGAVSFYNPQNTFVRQEVTLLNASTIAKNSVVDGTKTVTKAGYRPLGVVGWTTSGSSSTLCDISDLYTSDRAAGTVTVGWQVRNMNTSNAATLTLQVNLLWVKMI